MSYDSDHRHEYYNTSANSHWYTSAATYNQEWHSDSYTDFNV